MTEIRLEDSAYPVLLFDDSTTFIGFRRPDRYTILAGASTEGLSGEIEVRSAHYFLSFLTELLRGHGEQS